MRPPPGDYKYHLAAAIRDNDVERTAKHMVRYDPQSWDPDVHGPWNLAVRPGSEAVLDFLILTEKPSEKLLVEAAIYACQIGTPETIRRVVELIRFDPRSPAAARMLYCAAYGGNADACGHLLDLGVDANAWTPEGPPLMGLAQRFLRMASGSVPKYYLASSTSGELVACWKLLVSRGAHEHAPWNGSTPNAAMTELPLDPRTLPYFLPRKGRK